MAISDLYGWVPRQNQLPIPAEQGSFLGFASAQRGPLSQLAYEMAGSPKAGPAASNTGYTTPPGVSMPDTVGPDAASGVLGSINSASSLYNQGQNLAGLLGGGADLSAVGSGAYANSALADAGFMSGTPALDLGAAGAGLSAIGGTGTGALGASTFAEFSPSSAAAIDAAAGGGSSAGSGALASSGLSTALPIAAIGWAVADALNKSGDIKSGATSALVKGLVEQAGWKLVYPRNQTYQMPDGRFIQVGREARAVSEALRKGDANAQELFDAWLATARTPG